MSKIIVFGDSIAYGKWDKEGGWVARLRKYIDETFNKPIPTNFQVYNCSIPGEVVTRLAKRFEQELLIRIPQQENTNNKNLVILSAGINDSCPNNWMTLHSTPSIEFKNAFKTMIEFALKHNCKVVCVGLTPVNITLSTGLLFSNEKVKEYDAYISEICSKKNILKVDLFDTLKQIEYEKLLVDVVHPNDKGHKILFEEVKKFLDKERLFDYLTS